MRTKLAALTVLTALLAWSSTVSAASYRWTNPDGTAGNERYWGIDKNWDANPTSTADVATDGIPNGNTDSISFDSNYMTSEKRALYLADAAGVAASFTIKSWSMSSSSSGNRAYSVNNVTGGSANLIFEANTGDASIAVSTNNNASTFNVGLLLKSNLQVKAGGSTATDNKVIFNGGIGESGAPMVMTILGNGNAGNYKVLLKNTNSYSGGTIIGGTGTNNNKINAIVDVGGTLGLGDVTVLGGVLTVNNVNGAIADDATLSITTGGVISLGTGVNETIFDLVVDGQKMAMGTWGATGSGATNINDTLFTGSGVLNVVPEPATMGLLAIGGVAALLKRRRR